jgi:hypothetical protein
MQVSISPIYNVPILWRKRKKSTKKQHKTGRMKDRKNKHKEIRLLFTGMSDAPFTVRAELSHTEHS